MHTISSRRALLAGAPAAAVGALAAGTAVNAMAVAIPRTAEVDPIFAIIAEHCAAIDASCRAVNTVSEMMDFGPNKDPRYDAAKDVSDMAHDRMSDAMWDVLTEQPTTLAGIAALLAHVGRDEWLDNREPEYDDQKETLLSTFIHEDFSHEFKRAAQDFPVRLAATMRSIIERGQL
jgi:hypothetical protein